MKAIIGGITIEGTPQEIMEYRRLSEAKALDKPHTNLHAVISSNSKCPNEGSPCYCTGACMGQQGITSYDLRKKEEYNKYELDRRC